MKQNKSKKLFTKAKVKHIISEVDANLAKTMQNISKISAILDFLSYNFTRYRLGGVPCMKQTKSMRFRELLPIILELENSKLHLQDGIIEILKKEHGLDINLNTYRNYLFRYAPKDENSSSEPLVATTKSIEQKTIIEPNQLPAKNSSEVGETIKQSPIETQDDDEVDPDVLNQMIAELEFEKKHLKTKSIFDK